MTDFVGGRAPGAPHPRETGHLFGQSAAEAAFLDAHSGGRLHHAWLITGPRGVGKATLAWRLARFLLAQPPETDPATPRFFDEKSERIFAENSLSAADLDIAPDDDARG